MRRAYVIPDPWYFTSSRRRNRASSQVSGDTSGTHSERHILEGIHVTLRNTRADLLQLPATRRIIAGYFWRTPPEKCRGFNCISISGRHDARGPGATADIAGFIPAPTDVECLRAGSRQAPKIDDSPPQHFLLPGVVSA